MGLALLALAGCGAMPAEAPKPTQADEPRTPPPGVVEVNPAPTSTADWTPSPEMYEALDVACNTQIAAAVELTSGSANALIAGAADTVRPGLECVLTETASPLSWDDFVAGVAAPRVWEGTEGTWAASGQVTGLGESGTVIVNLFYVGNGAAAD